MNKVKLPAYVIEDGYVAMVITVKLHPTSGTTDPNIPEVYDD